MEAYLIYFLKVITLQTILFGLYWILNRNAKSFLFNRYFLLSALTLPFIIPLLNIPINLFQRDIATESIFDPWFFIEQSLPIITINGNEAVTSSSSWWTGLVLVIYLMVAVPATIKLAHNYFSINQLIKSSSKKEYTPKGFRLLYVPTKILSFSFLNKIFLSDLFPLEKHEKNTIITHEEYHLSQRHSFDIILSELVRIICWFNPIVLLIQKNLKETHEFLADRYTIKHYGRNDYAALLKSFKWQEINMMLGNAYSSTSIKKRMNMMEKPTKKSPILRLVFLCAITLFTAFLFACEDNLDTFESKNLQLEYELTNEELQIRIDKTIDRLSKQNAPQEMVETYIREQSNHPENEYRAYVVTFADDGSGSISAEKMKARIEKRRPLKSEAIYVKKVPRIEFKVPKENDFFIEEFRKNSQRNRFAIIEKINRLDLAIYNYKMSGERGIQDDFDKPAQFKGGPAQLAQYLKSTMEYPEIAEKLGIEDIVVLSFVVGKSGGLLYVNIAKEPATDNEEVSIALQKAAFHAVKSTSGMWNAAEKDGRFVQTRITLPIEFKLDN